MVQSATFPDCAVWTRCRTKGRRPLYGAVLRALLLNPDALIGRYASLQASSPGVMIVMEVINLSIDNIIFWRHSMATSEIAALKTMLRGRTKALATTERRLAYDALGDMFPVRADVKVEQLIVGGVAAESTTTSDVRGPGVILYLHGGGYVYGSTKSHRHLVSELGRAAGARAIAIDYRRAPEAPFPAALDDALAAWSALLEDHQPQNMILAGDSAGGGLAVALMVRLQELGLPQPSVCVLLSPWVDMLAAGETYTVNAERDPVVGKEIITFCARQYLGEGGLDHPLASPLRSNLKGIAPLAIFAGSTETLLDDSIQLARQAGIADVPVRLEVWPGMFHIWPTYHQMLAEGRKAISQIGAIMRSAIQAEQIDSNVLAAIPNQQTEQKVE
jgi:monoterpene epsilon-lactone hydrolase